MQYDSPTPTVVESFMSDYEKSSRNAVKKTWSKCKVLGCAVHFQRAVFKFGRKHNVYSDMKKVFARNLLAQAYGLCYVPESGL